MKKLFFALTILISCIFSTSAHSLGGCDKIYTQPQINIYTSYGKLKYDFSLDQIGITQKAMKNGNIEKGIFADGLATQTLDFTLSIKAASKKGYNKQYCAVPVEIDFFLGYRNPTIYVSKDLPQGSCRHDLVLRHEQTHQRINIKTLEYFLPLFEQALQKISKEIPAEPIYSNSQQALNKGSHILAERYKSRIDPLIEVFKKELEIEQGKLDNVSNYSFEGSICR